MYSEMKNEPGGMIRISAHNFARAMDKIASDHQFRQRLEQDPIETLASIGIELDESLRAQLEGKTLSQVINEEKAMPTEDAWVWVLTRVATIAYSSSFCVQ